MIKYLCFTILVCASAKEINAQEKINGSLIPEYGAIYTVPNPDLNTNDLQEYKAVFDLSAAPEDPAELNPNFERVARFLNLHAAAGVPLEKIKPVMVVHGNAAMALLQDQHYKEIFGVANPNIDLLNKLHALGVPVILCGQTAGARDISKEKRWQHAQVALSAMTALVYYQSKNYALINF